MVAVISSHVSVGFNVICRGQLHVIHTLQVSAHTPHPLSLEMDKHCQAGWDPGGKVGTLCFIEMGPKQGGQLARKHWKFAFYFPPNCRHYVVVLLVVIQQKYWFALNLSFLGCSHACLLFHIEEQMIISWSWWCSGHFSPTCWPCSWFQRHRQPDAKW